jgi:hypothetical protein
VQRTGLPTDAVVLSGVQLAELQDRLFQLRCAAEDISTAAQDGAGPGELVELARRLAEHARELEKLR